MPDLPQSIQNHILALEEYFQAENSRNTYDFITDGLNYQFSTGGKRLRPALCLLSCELFGGESTRALPSVSYTHLTLPTTPYV